MGHGSLFTGDILCTASSQTRPKIIRWDRALTTFEEMRRMGIKPDVLSYNALISALANGGKHARAMQMYESMVRDGIRPDETTHQFVEAIKASAWATGQEELHVDEDGNVDVR